MDRQAELNYIKTHCIIAVVRAYSGGEDVVRVVQPLAERFVRCIEFTITTPGALHVLEIASQPLSGLGLQFGRASVRDTV